MDTGEIADFCKKSNIELLVLFGSYAGGKVRSTSDMDLAVKVRRGVEFSKLDLIYNNLGRFFEGKEIDLVVLTREMDPVLLKEIFSGGKALYEERAGFPRRETKGVETLRRYGKASCDAKRISQETCGETRRCLLMCQ